MMLLVGLLSGTCAQAAGTKYICKEIDASGAVRTVVLTQYATREIREGGREPFTLEIFETGEKTPTLVSSGSVTTDDVLFQFKSTDRKVSFKLYMDELDQSSMMLNNRPAGSFNCR